MPYFVGRAAGFVCNTCKNICTLPLSLCVPCQPEYHDLAISGAFGEKYYAFCTTHCLLNSDIVKSLQLVENLEQVCLSPIEQQKTPSQDSTPVSEEEFFSSMITTEVLDDLVDIMN